jgi:CheY-like chemotaxis protein
MSMSANAARAAAPASSAPTRLCLLVVEDDEADAYLIGRTLSDNPVVGQVVHARDGAEALAMVETGQVAPDLAFIDLHMPRMNGFDLLVAFAERSEPKFPMVVLTSSAAPNDAIRSRLRSAVRVITKPDTVTELYAVLQTAIEAICPSGARSASRPLNTPAFLLMSPRFPGLRRATTADEAGG